MPKGRRPKGFGDFLVVRKAGSPEKSIATREEKLFLGTRTGEIAHELLAARGLLKPDGLTLTDEAAEADLQDLFEEAQDRATEELKKAIRNKRTLIAYKNKVRGRPRGASSRGAPDDAELARKYHLARDRFHADASIRSISSYLYRRYYSDASPSSDALYQRVKRALKKMGQKRPAK